MKQKDIVKKFSILFLSVFVLLIFAGLFLSFTDQGGEVNYNTEEDQFLSQPKDTLPEEESSKFYLKLNVGNNKIVNLSEVTKDESIVGNPEYYYVYDDGSVELNYGGILGYKDDSKSFEFRVVELHNGIYLYEDALLGEIYEDEILPLRWLPIKIEYYDLSSGLLKNTYYIQEHNPYSKDREPALMYEQFYDSESGQSANFSNGSYDYSKEIAGYLSQSYVLVKENNQTIVIYYLMPVNKHRGLLDIISSLYVLDNNSDEIFSYLDKKIDYQQTLITPDNKYFLAQSSYQSATDFKGAVLNPRRTSVTVFDMETGRIIYSDTVEKSIDYFNGISYEAESGLIVIDKVVYINNLESKFKEILDLNRNLKFSKEFSKEELSYISKNWFNEIKSYSNLLNMYGFNETEF